MSEFALSDEEKLRQALSTIQGAVAKRNDSFDIGGNPGNTAIAASSPEIISIFNNPSQLASLLDVSEAQAENLRSLIVGGGTGAVYRLLNKHLGGEVSAALGGLLSAWAAKKLLGGK